MKTALDLAIKLHKKGTLDGGFAVGQRVYDCYIGNEEWSAFVQEMKNLYPFAYVAFAKGDGDELGLKKTYTPPKMACYGSLAVSNRMETALKRHFTRLRAFAPLQYVDTAAVATAQIHRKIPVLRCLQFSRA